MDELETGTNSVSYQTSCHLFVTVYRIYCNEIFVLRRPIVSKFITTAHNDFVVIEMIFPVVTGFFSYSVVHMEILIA